MGGHRIATTSSNPGINFYCGTKFMVRALTEGLRREVKSANTRIRVAVSIFFALNCTLN